MPAYYPPVAFHFRVEVLDIPANGSDLRFAEVSGLSVELGTEEIAEGGENRFVQKYPTRAKYTELTLKRGLLANSEVHAWVRECIEDFRIRPKDLVITLLNASHEPLMTWHVIGAFPTRWSVSDLNATSNAVLIESIQLCYRRFTVTKS